MTEVLEASDCLAEGFLVLCTRTHTQGKLACNAIGQHVRLPLGRPVPVRVRVDLGNAGCFGALNALPPFLDRPQSSSSCAALPFLQAIVHIVSHIWLRGADAPSFFLSWCHLVQLRFDLWLSFLVAS